MASSTCEARFNKTRRLLEASDFKQVFDNNNVRVSNQHLLILGLQRRDTQCSRLGMVISKKTVRRAVDRNRIKRNIREFFRQEVTGNIISADYVVLSRQGIADISGAALYQLLKTQFTHIQVKLKKSVDKQPSHEYSR